MLQTKSRHMAWLLVAISLVATLLLAACGGDDDDDADATTPADGSAAATATSAPTKVEVTHFAGKDTVPVKPETVVVFDLGVFLSLNALGVEVDALGGVNVPIPAEFKAAVENPKLKKVGTAFEPDYEAVNAMEPDLIIVAGRSSAAFPEMKKIAPTIDLTIDQANFMQSFRERHEVLGKVFGVEEKVAAELKRLETAIAEVSAKGPGAGSALVLMTSGAEVSAYGPGSRFGLIHDVFGFKAADESLERDATHGDVVSFEFVLKAQPSVLFVIDRSASVGQEGEAAKKILDNKLVGETPAWKNGRVVYVDGFAWYIAPNSLPGIFAMVDDARDGLGKS